MKKKYLLFLFVFMIMFSSMKFVNAVEPLECYYQEDRLKVHDGKDNKDYYATIHYKITRDNNGTLTFLILKNDGTYEKYAGENIKSSPYLWANWVNWKIEWSDDDDKDCPTKCNKDNYLTDMDCSMVCNSCKFDLEKKDGNTECEQTSFNSYKGVKFKIDAFKTATSCPENVKLTFSNQDGETSITTYGDDGQCTGTKQMSGDGRCVENEVLTKEYDCTFDIEYMNIKLNVSKYADTASKAYSPKYKIFNDYFSIIRTKNEEIFNQVNDGRIAFNSNVNSKYSFGAHFYLKVDDIDNIINSCKNGNNITVYPTITTKRCEGTTVATSIVTLGTVKKENWYEEVYHCNLATEVQLPGAGTWFNKDATIKCDVINGKLADWLNGAFSAIKIGAVVLVIVLSGVDAIKSLASFEEKNSKSFYKRLVIRLICLAVIFLTHSLVRLLLNFAGSNEQIAEILKNPFCGIFR